MSIDQGLGILVWSPLAGGLLSGKYRRQGTEATEGSRHLSGEWDEPPIYDQDKLYDTIETLVEIGSARGVSAAQIALAYLIGKPAVTSVIVGARTEEQLTDNLASAEIVSARIIPDIYVILAAVDETLPRSQGPLAPWVFVNESFEQVALTMLHAPSSGEVDHAYQGFAAGRAPYQASSMSPGPWTI